MQTHLMGQQRPSSVHIMAVELRIHRLQQLVTVSLPLPFSVARWAARDWLGAWITTLMARMTE